MAGRLSEISGRLNEEQEDPSDVGKTFYLRYVSERFNEDQEGHLDGTFYPSDVSWRFNEEQEEPFDILQDISS